MNYQNVLKNLVSKSDLDGHEDYNQNQQNAKFQQIPPPTDMINKNP